MWRRKKKEWAPSLSSWWPLGAVGRWPFSVCVSFFVAAMAEDQRQMPLAALHAFLFAFRFFFDPTAVVKGKEATKREDTRRKKKRAKKPRTRRKETRASSGKAGKHTRGIKARVCDSRCGFSLGPFLLGPSWCRDVVLPREPLSLFSSIKTLFPSCFRGTSLRAVTWRPCRVRIAIILWIDLFLVDTAAASSRATLPRGRSDPIAAHAHKETKGQRKEKKERDVVDHADAHDDKGRRHACLQAATRRRRRILGR